MRNVLLIFCLSAQGAQADVMFENKSDGLPQHMYSGGWEHFVGGGLAVFDCNDDDLPDVFAAGGETRSVMFKNDGSFEFSTFDIPELLGATGAYPLDINGDGITDLFVLRVGSNVALKGGADCDFTDATQEWGIPADDRWSTAFSAWWGPGDIRPTLAVGNYVDRTDPDGPFEACDDNILLTPDADGFTSELLSPGYCPLSMLAAEDAFGRYTLRISNDRHYYVSEGKEQMWDIAEHRFLGPDDGWQDISLWGMGIASRDLTGDGVDEVMLTSMGDQVLQIAQPEGGYKKTPYSTGTYAHVPHTGDDGRPSTGWHAEFADVNNDGLADLFMAKGNVDQMPGMATRDPNNLLVQQSDGTFVEEASDAGVATLGRSRGAALADFDNDGRLDLIVTNRRAPIELYRNVTPSVGNWLRVNLAQSGANLDAIGARVEVITETNRQSAQKVVGGGHAGGQLLPQHFGLGQDTTATIRVTWPDGTVQTEEANAGQVVTIQKRP